MHMNPSGHSSMQLPSTAAGSSCFPERRVRSKPHRPNVDECKFNSPAKLPNVDTTERVDALAAAADMTAALQKMQPFRIVSSKLNGTDLRPLEQASLFLCTSAACRLAGTCHGMRLFLENASAECAYWDAPPVCGEGMYSHSSLWLHSMVGLKQASKFAALARQCGLHGKVSFQQRSDVTSLTRILQLEKMASAASHIEGMTTTYFAVAWRFDPTSIAKLLDSQTRAQVDSEVWKFKYRYSQYGESLSSFKMTISRESSDSKELMFRLSPAEMMSKFLSDNTTVSCSVVVTDREGSIFDMQPFSLGDSLNNVEAEWNVGYMGADYEPAPVISHGRCRFEWKPFDRLLSVVRVVAPSWIERECKAQPMKFHWKEKPERSHCTIS